VPRAVSLRVVVTLAATAKLTVNLRITGVRSDGYHLIDAEMTSIDLCDELEISGSGGCTPAGASQVRMLDEHGAAVTGAPAMRDNLIYRALQLCGRAADVTVRKRIPAGAGLGGGSSDAAAVLRWAGEQDFNRAASLGADVAFCLAGGRARVTGIGENIETLPFVDERYTLQLVPVFCSTAQVYATWDELGTPEGINGNDLEPAALKVAPQLARWRDQFGDDTGLTPRLAGSGSTWFVKGEYPGPGRIVVSTLR